MHELPPRRRGRGPRTHFTVGVLAGMILVGMLMEPSVLAAQPAPRHDSILAITRVSIVDVERGRELADHTVLVRAGRIVAVGPSSHIRVPSGARMVDGRGRWLIPGLWDMHVHTTGPSSERILPVYVAYGVTGVRDMGSDLEVLRHERDRVRTGATVGPRIVMAGPILDGPIGAPMPAAHRRWRIELTDSASARLVVDSVARAGADFIKVHERLSPSVYQAIAHEARRARLPFAGHVPTTVGPLAAVDAGQRSIEHLVNVPLACTAAETTSLRARTPLEALLGRCSADDLAPLYGRFAAASVRHTPTLVVQQSIALRPDTQPGDPGTRHVPAPVREMLHEVGPFSGPLPPVDVRRRLRALFEKRVQQVGAMHRAGVPLLVGTDAPAVAPGWSVHEELRLLARAGLRPAEALRAATLEPARWLGASDSLGAIASGRRADLVLLDADPLADIRNTMRIRTVVADGRVYDRTALDDLLARAARDAGAPGAQAPGPRSELRLDAQLNRPDFAIPDGSPPLRAAFVALTLAIAALFVAAVHRSARRTGRDPRTAARQAAIAAVLSLAWIAATGLLASRGVLRMWDPPTMGLVLGPTFLIAIGIALSPLGRQLVAGIPIAWIVGFQGFRILVELLLHRAYVEGLMPVQMSWSGRNLDVVSGVSAIAVGLWLARAARPSSMVVALWNTLGVALLANILVVALLSAPTPFRFFTNDPPNVFITRAPWVWLPAVMVLAAILGHALVIRWLLEQMRPRVPASAEPVAGRRGDPSARHS